MNKILNAIIAATIISASTLTMSDASFSSQRDNPEDRSRARNVALQTADRESQSHRPLIVWDRTSGPRREKAAAGTPTAARKRSGWGT